MPTCAQVFLDHSEAGHGPRLHRHPYDETWVVIDANPTFETEWLE